MKAPEIGIMLTFGEQRYHAPEGFWVELNGILSAYERAAGHGASSAVVDETAAALLVWRGVMLPEAYEAWAGRPCPRRRT